MPKLPIEVIPMKASWLSSIKYKGEEIRITDREAIRKILPEIDPTGKLLPYHQYGEFNIRIVGKRGSKNRKSVMYWRAPKDSKAREKAGWKVEYMDL